PSSVPQRTIGSSVPQPMIESSASQPTTEKSVSQFSNRAAWLKDRLAERGWNKHDLQRYNAPEHRTTQKILNGLSVQDGSLQKVIVGLNSKLTHKKRTLRPVTESDIPND